MHFATGGSPPLDTTVVVTTPENVAFDFRIAGPFPRFLAMLVDFAVILGGMLVFAFALGMLGASGIGLLLILFFIVFWGYGGLMESLCNGQTLGKRALGIRVVSDSGLSINAGQAILRNILRAADLIPPFFPGVAAMLFSSRFQRLGDLAAETMVVFDGGRSLPYSSTTVRMTNEFRSRIPARFRPDASLVESLAAYVGRRGDLSKPRRRELSQPLAMHFIRTWNLPAKSDPDFVLCALYEFATMDVTEALERSNADHPKLEADSTAAVRMNQRRTAREKSTDSHMEDS